MNFKSSMGLAVVAAVVVSACPALSSAAVIYSDIVANPFSTGHAWGLSGATAGPSPFYNGYASSFTPASDSVATQVDVVVAQNDGTPVVDVGIYNDVGGFPGTLISSLDAVAIPASPTDPESVTLTTSAALTGGQTYWVAVLPGATDTRAFWDQNPNLGQTVGFTFDAGSTWSDSGFGNTAFPGEFDVLGTVPEPASLSLLCIGAAGMLWKRRRAR